MVRRLGGEMKLTKDMKQSRYRMPEVLLEYLQQQASANLRSVNAEVVIRLAKSMEEDKARERH